MALIKCPHCGKEISDTAESCIHCGTNLNEKTQAQEQFKNYESLSFSEKLNLKSEFNKAYPNYAKYEDKDEKIKRLGKISWACIIIGIIMMIPLFFSESKFFLIIGILGAILFTVSDVVDILCPFLRRRYKKKYLIALKKYQKWLKETKGVNYIVTFNSAEMKWKKYFDAINIDFEKI